MFSMFVSGLCASTAGVIFILGSIYGFTTAMEVTIVFNLALAALSIILELTK